MALKKMTRLRVSSADIVQMQVAALAIEDIRGAMAERESGILAAVAPGAEAVVTWHHYPQDDVYDPSTTPVFLPRSRGSTACGWRAQAFLVQLSSLRELRASQSIWLSTPSMPLRRMAEDWGEGHVR